MLERVCGVIRKRERETERSDDMRGGFVIIRVVSGASAWRISGEMCRGNFRPKYLEGAGPSPSLTFPLPSCSLPLHSLPLEVGPLKYS